MRNTEVVDPPFPVPTKVGNISKTEINLTPSLPLPNPMHVRLPIVSCFASGW